MQTKDKSDLLSLLFGCALTGVVLAMAVTTCAANEKIIAKSAQDTWPVGKSPTEVGNKVANNVVSRPLTYLYYSVCSYYGVLIFSEATNNTELRNSVIATYEPYLMGEKSPRTGHVDNNLFGIVPFEIYRQTKNKKYLAVAKILANDEWEYPRPDGLTKYTRFSADDMYMVGTLQAHAYKATGDSKYAYRGIKFILAYVEKLQQPNGLFIYHQDLPFLWGRGIGWSVGCLTEMLLALPEDHPKRAKLMDVYRKLIEGLVKYQDKSGMWHQVVDNSNFYLESSGTGMFIFAIATGVKQGWLPEKPYRDVAERGWLALTDYVDSQGLVREVSTGGVALIGASIDYHSKHGAF